MAHRLPLRTKEKPFAQGEPRPGKEVRPTGEERPFGLGSLGPCLDFAAPARLEPWQIGQGLGRSPGGCGGPQPSKDGLVRHHADGRG